MSFAREAGALRSGPFGLPGAADGFGGLPARPQRPKAQRIMPLREPCAGRVGEEGAVGGPRHRKARRGEDKDLPKGRADEVLAPDALGYPHARVVEGARQLVAGAIVLA